MRRTSMRRDYARSRDRMRVNRDFGRMKRDYHINDPISKFSTDYGNDRRERDYEDKERRRIEYNDDYRDYRDYNEMEDEYYDDLERLEKKLKRKSRFETTEKEIAEKARLMNVDFKDYDETEFYVVFLMLTTDFPKVSNSVETYVEMAKDWLEDDDIAVSPSEKLCIYLYSIIKGED